MSCARSSLLLVMRMWPLLLYDAPPSAWDSILTPPWDPGPRVLCCDIKQNRPWRRPKNPDIAAHYLSDDPNRTGGPNSRTSLAPRPGCVLRYLTREAESKPKTGNIAAQYSSDVLGPKHPTLNVTYPTN